MDGWNGGWQGAHRLDKICVHDFSMTISLLDFAFAAFCRNVQKYELSKSMLNFLVVAKDIQNLIQFGSKIGKIP